MTIKRFFVLLVIAHCATIEAALDDDSSKASRFMDKALEDIFGPSPFFNALQSAQGPTAASLGASSPTLMSHSEGAMPDDASGLMSEDSEADDDESAEQHVSMYASGARVVSARVRQNKEGLFFCGQCSLKFLRSNSALQHFKEQHVVDKKELTKLLKNKICNCGHYSFQGSNIKQHFKTCRRQHYFCGPCSFSCSQPESLEEHLLKMHQHAQSLSFLKGVILKDDTLQAHIRPNGLEFRYSITQQIIARQDFDELSKASIESVVDQVIASRAEKKKS